jgi:hypothetical protein
VGNKKLVDIRIMREILQHQVNGDTRALNHWLTREDPWVCNNVFLVESRPTFKGSK